MYGRKGISESIRVPSWDQVRRNTDSLKGLYVADLYMQLNSTTIEQKDQQMYFRSAEPNGVK